MSSDRAVPGSPMHFAVSLELVCCLGMWQGRSTINVPHGRDAITHWDMGDSLQQSRWRNPNIIAIKISDTLSDLLCS